MKCNSCGKKIPSILNAEIKFCPFCGARLFEDGRYYIVEITCSGQREGEESMMLVFVDEKQLYEVMPGESVKFALTAGYHTLKFRQKVRSKSINLLFSSDYMISAYYNSLSGLIETNIIKSRGSGGGYTKKEIDKKILTMPVMVSDDGQKSFDVMLGDDNPEYEFRVSSGFKEGILRLYSERAEFEQDNQLKKEIIHYNNIVAVKKKMGAIDLQCEGNVHIVYSIPKDIYNEVMLFLNNKIGEVRGRV